ncbi:MAG: hypothetical protein RL383_1483, partial [Actinomycetota bacterium]
CERIGARGKHHRAVGTPDQALVAVSRLVHGSHVGLRVGRMARGTCSSCGSPDEDLQKVRRVYFADGDGGTDQVDDDVESWCASCLTLYPHVPAG